jgi:hypothetical protein
VVEILALEARAEAAEVARRQLAVGAPVAAEQAAREHAVGGHADPELAQRGQDLGLDAARDQRVLDLQVADRVNGRGTADRVCPGLREADVAHVPGLHHLGDRADRLLDRDRGVDAREAVDVDVVGAEAVERVGEEALHGGGTAVDAQPGAGWVAQRAELDADRHRVSVAVLQCLGDQQLVAARAVEIARVDQGDAGIDRGVDRGDALALVGGAIEVGHAHGAEADGGDVGARGSKLACVHVSMVGLGGAQRKRGSVVKPRPIVAACPTCASCARSSRSPRS